MTSINILHISDIHWSPANEKDVRIVVDALIRDIDNFKKSNINSDILIFSGDLVQSGADLKHFDKAYEATVARVAKAANISKERIFICPGNHDIDRSQIADFMENGLKSSLKSTKIVNDFIDNTNNGNSNNKIAFDRLKNYNNFMRSRIQKPPNVLNNQMLQVFRFPYGDEEVGIAIFNTSWRCTGQPNDADRNFLVLGERNVDNALDHLNSCDIKIAVFHHPTDWLSDFDQASVLSRLYSGFDLIAHGHIHRPLPEQRFTTSGTALISQAGCLYNSRDYPNSYQLVTIDTDNAQATFRIRTFFDTPRREFDAAVNITAEGILKCEMMSQKKHLITTK